MKLDFLEVDEVGHLISTIITRTFDIAVKEYGIVDTDGEVRLTFVPVSLSDVSLEKTASGFGVRTTSGETHNKIYPGNIVTVKLRMTGGPKQLVHTWAHELAHVTQLFKGRLRQDTHDPKNKGLVWDGQFFGIKKINTLGKQEKLPWELDADAEADRILPKVIHDLQSYIKSPTGRASIIQEAKEILGCADGSPGAA